jgi:hypothetical protein
MKIIGYTYEADYHCVECTQKRWQVDTDATKYVRKPELWHEVLDEHGVPYKATDREGNNVHPIFSTDELPCDISDEGGGYSPVVCGDCGEVIREGELFA